MTRRPLRSHFSSGDQSDLLASMRKTRDITSRLMASVNPTSDRYLHCLAVGEAIDRLAGDLTGDASIFHAKPHG